MTKPNKSNDFKTIIPKILLAILYPLFLGFHEKQIKAQKKPIEQAAVTTNITNK